MNDFASHVQTAGAPIGRTSISFLYRTGLVVVAAAMVLLPIVYAALIVLAGYGVQWHARNDTWIFDGGGGGLIKVALYFGPIVAGTILVFFMVKPFFARPAREAERVGLDAERAPRLFALIDQICATIGAPRPVRVQVDCSVNAAASLTGPFKLVHRKLALTIGLPLAAGLTMQQLAGVLAHEFGHFAQGAGMRLTYAIRSINHWLWRVVNERDDWDVRLDSWSRGGDARIAIVFALARGAIWCTRRVLWALMMTGHMISCFMLRQMEYDADSYEIRIAGSAAFEATMVRLRELNIAAQLGYGDVRQGWLDRALPDDFAALVVSRTCDMAPEMRENAQLAPVPTKQKLFDTHPTDERRVEAARGAADPGLFHRTDPASELFDDFAALSRIVTRDHYERLLQLDLSAVRIVEASATIRHSRHATDTIRSLNRLFNDNVNVLRPIVVDSGSADSAVEPAQAWEVVAVEKRAIREMAARHAEVRERFADLERQRLHATAARVLVDAGYHLVPQDLGFAPETTEPIAAVIARVTGEQTELGAQLSEYEQHVGRQLAAARHIPQVGAGPNVAELFRVLTIMNNAYAAVVSLHERLTIVDLGLAHARSRQHFEPLNQILYGLEDELRKSVDRIRDALSDAPYPFAENGPLALNSYLRPPDVTTEDLAAVLNDAQSHRNNFFQVYWRIIGELALAVEQLEAPV